LPFTTIKGQANQIIMLLETVLEIIKFTVPALIVFLTVYYLQKQYLKNQYNLQLLDLKKNHLDNTLPLKLQAYERLTLFLERLKLENIILRIRTENMTASNLHIALLVAIQKEFEHNVAQQVYVSPELWEIITLVKNEIINLVNVVAKEQESNTDAIEYSRDLFNRMNGLKIKPVEKALLAIKKEASLIL